MNSPELISKIYASLAKNCRTVSEIEMTSGNYDLQGSLIKDDIPTVTTELCEVGAYNDTCYFTVILESDQLTRELFSLVSAYPNVQVYGLRNFTENYYPKENFQYEKLEKHVSTEEYFQIQFNLDTKEMDAKYAWNKYLEVEELFRKADVKVENQLEKDFRVG